MKKIKILYSIGYNLSKFVFKIIYRREIKGKENIPLKGPAIIASNHFSYADPPLIGSSMSFPVHYLAKEELFKIPILGYIIKRTNAFAIKRGHIDKTSLKNAIALLNKGEILLIFPEGTRRKTEDFKPKSGISLIAKTSHVPIVPVKIVNSKFWYKFKKITVIFGKHININEIKDLNHKETSSFILSKIEELN